MNPRALMLSKVALHTALLLPLISLTYAAIDNGLGADPAEAVVRDLGFYGACILWVSLMMTPMRRVTKASVWIRYRRALGLWGFFYLTLHLSAFIVFWAGLDVTILFEELTQRPYIYLGVTAWMLMLPLAVTSTKAMQKRLGRRWSQLHRLVYFAASLGAVHILWIAKLDYTQAILFAVVLILGFVIRLRKA